MFLQLGLPTFCTIRHNAKLSFVKCKDNCFNHLVYIVSKFCVTLSSVGFILGFISTVYIV